jgi:hypothetical protein
MQQYRNQDSQQPARSERQHANVAFAVLTHAVKMAVSLAPLAILELMPNDPTRAHRLIKGVAIIGTGLNETLWSVRVARSKEEHRHR